MRVLTFMHSFAPGGVERDALRLARAWSEDGVAVRVVVGRPIGPLAGEADGLDLRVLTPTAGFARHFESLFMIARLPAEIRSYRPDVLFCAGNTYTIVAVAMRLLLGRRCPPIVLKVSNDLERRDLPGWRRAAYHWWLRRQAFAFAAIVAMAAPARAEIAAHMRVSAERITVIENASIRDDEIARLAAARAAHPRDHRGRRFLGVGRLAAQKNFALLIAAFARIAQADDRLTIVGEGPERARLEALAAELGVGRQVDLPGYRHPLDAEFAAADLFVLSSDFEGLGVVVIEALAAGTPIVATDCCVNMAMLVDGVGRLVPTRDLRALAAALDAPPPVADRSETLRRARAFTVEATAPRWRALFDAFYLP